MNGRKHEDNYSAEPPDAQVGARDKNVDWFIPELQNLSDQTRSLLETYSGIPASDVESHVLAVREKAWNIFPYPCIGQWRFLDLSIGRHELYPEILSRMKSGQQKYLDLGCCFGQDIRRLVADGVDSGLCFGSDLRLDFMELGYDMFLDRSKLKSKFIAGDVFDENSDLKELNGQVDIIHAAAFFHLFDYAEQKQIAHRVVKLLKPQKDSLLLGRQVGNVTAGSFQHRTNKGSTMYRHNDQSLKKMWDEVGKEVGGIKFETKVEMTEWVGFKSQDQANFHHEGAQRLQYSVRRL